MEGWVTKMLNNLVLMLVEDSSETVSVESGMTTSRLRARPWAS